MYGLVAGLAAVAFQRSITLLYNNGLVRLSHEKPVVFELGSLAVIVCTSLLVGFLLNSFCDEASGSGIPQLKMAFWKDFGFVRWRVVWVKFVAGVLSIGGGCSLGREGPSVHVAGGLASQTAGLFGEPKQGRRLAAAAGAAAGLAAAFNTPLAAVTFVLEEIIADLNSRLLGGVLLASVIGAFVVHGFIGKQPAFKLAGAEAPGWLAYVLTPIVAGLAALVGVVFQKWTMGLRIRRKNLPRLPRWAQPCLGGIVTWAIGTSVFLQTGHLGVFSLGYEDLTAALAHKMSWELAGVLMGTKLIAIVACYGLGGCGGIFSPTLFLGGMCGMCFAGLWSHVVPLSSPDQLALGVVGMSACLGAVVRAPVTGILIVFEMTHEFSLVPALMVGALVSQALSLKLLKHNFYEEILVQDGHNLEHFIPPRDLHTWQQMPVSAIANFQPIIANDLAAEAVRKLMRSHPYQRFPFEQGGRLAGLLTRKEAEAALAENRVVRLEPAVQCLPTQTVRELQSLLIESASLVVILVDRPDGKILGMLTLHDLLRAEVAKGKETG
ncbi:MAG TPA: chloride channel protein [Verrucomicrobiae bacterium]|nr:chloride channel protein [Verrucomicrobiae bacterium]